MKIIDENGRLFSKINVIDFLGLLLFLSCISIFYFGYNKLGQKSEFVTKPKEYVEIELRCRIVKINPAILNSISVGDKEFSKDGDPTGEIIWLGESKPYESKLNIGPDSFIVNKNKQFKELPAIIKIKARIGGDQEDLLFYKNKQIVLNSSFEFKTVKYSLTVTPIIFINGTQRPIDKIDINVMFKDLSEDEIKLISIGDKEMDKNGEVIAEILDIGRKENNMLEIDLGNNNSINGVDSKKLQLNVKMRLKGEIGNNNKLYFRDKCISYNTSMEFNTNRYTIRGVVGKALLKERWLFVHVKFNGLIPELAQLVAEGDEDKDLEGELRGRIKSIIGNKPSDIMVFTAQGNKYIRIANPYQMDVTAVLELRCEDRDGILFYKNYPIKIGNVIIFSTNQYNLNGTITKLEIK